MGILTRYLIRAHVGPFIFALTALTALIFLNAVAQRLELLAGKGLTWDVIAEFLVLSLPHTIALTLPMAVLVAVLYTFSELTSGNEITAMAAGGVKPTRLLLPVVGMGILLGGVMFYFNDQLLPESNHRLKNLMSDLVRKSPTFELREQVVNEIQGPSGQTMYYLQATTIDSETNDLDDVVIYDVSDAGAHRTIYADRGTMAFSEGRTDLFLTLYEGVIHEVDDQRPGAFQRSFFQTQVIPLRGVADVLERQLGGGQRSDREMTIAMLRERVETQHVQIREIQARSRALSAEAVRVVLGMPTAEEGPPAESEGEEAPVVEAPGEEAPGVESDNGALPWIERRGEGMAGDSAALASSAALLRGGDVRAPSLATAGERAPREVAEQLQADANRVEVLRLNAYRYEVEIHKKFAIAFACIIFVLLGAPLAMRFPRGGVGMVIAVSLLIFGIYWVGLLGGERLADRGRADPFWAMWAANFLFMGVAVWLLAGIGKAGSTTRGGGWDDLVFTARRRIGRAFGRKKARGAASDPEVGVARG